MDTSYIDNGRGRNDPTNNAPLTNFRLSSNTEILLTSIERALQIGAKRCKDVHAMRIDSDWASILHTTVGSWGGGKSGKIWGEKKGGFCSRAITKEGGNYDDNSTTALDLQFPRVPLQMCSKGGHEKKCGLWPLLFFFFLSLISSSRPA